MSSARSLADLRAINSFAALPEVFYTRLTPQTLNQPRLLHANPEAAGLLGLDPAVFARPEFLAVFSGAAALPGGDCLATVYSGHQFGVWAGQLGDGRAHLLGEIAGPQSNWELQLKGAGRTPYSRMGDGRAVLRSSVREYLASVAMQGLGIPTTQALALVTSDDPVYRETVETAAIVTRMAPSFVRFGSFEQWSVDRDTERLQILADYVITRFYPQCYDAAEGPPLVALLRAVTHRTARLMADWQAVGFCHGVMNTDNMSILGLTLDYGPYGFMDGFQLAHICNHSDTQGRYAWYRQPSVALWNLYRLASSFQTLLQDEAALRVVLDEYEQVFTQAFYTRMGAKLGLSTWRNEDALLLDDLLKLMDKNRADFTLCWRHLATALEGQRRAFEDLFIDRVAAAAWLDRFLARQTQQARPVHETVQAMNRVNPLYVLRNHLAEQAIRAAQQGDAGEIDTLMRLLRDPYTPQAGYEAYASLPPDWAAGIEVSCSS